MSRGIQMTPSQRELTEETLQLLADYLKEIANLSAKFGATVSRREPIEIPRLIEGLELILEAVRQIRDAMELYGRSPTHDLEEELAAVLGELNDALDRSDRPAQVEALTIKLPAQLGRWAGEGIQRFRALMEPGAPDPRGPVAEPT